MKMPSLFPRRKIWSLAHAPSRQLALISAVVAAACGGAEPEFGADEPLPQPTPDSSEGNSSEGNSSEGNSSEGNSSTGSATLEMELAAPGYLAQSYPAGPYGSVPGSQIENLTLLGWSRPTDVDFDASEMEAVSLARFYNSDGAGGTELILINAVAVWCGACRLEYREFDEKGIYKQYQPRGLEMLGVLFEDNSSPPGAPTYVDLTNWARAFNVAFPFVMDPGFQTGVYFDRAATPMNMLVDARTMQILFSFTGYSEEIFEQIDRLLTQRGR